MLHCNIANQTVEKTVGNYVIVAFPISRSVADLGVRGKGGASVPPFGGS